MLIFFPLLLEVELCEFKASERKILCTTRHCIVFFVRAHFKCSITQFACFPNGCMDHKMNKKNNNQTEKRKMKISEKNEASEQHEMDSHNIDSYNLCIY